MGTIIRLADWFGVGHILCTSDSVDQYNPKVIQSAMGSISRVNIHYGDLVHMLTQLESHKIYACDLNGESIYDASFKEKALIMGSESHGHQKKFVGWLIVLLQSHLFQIQALTLNVASAGISLSLLRSK